MNYENLFSAQTGVPMTRHQRDAMNNFNDMVYSGTIRTETVDVCFCGCSDFIALTRFDRYGLPFGTQICRDCGLISQTRRIAPVDLPKFYNEIYWPLVTNRKTFETAPKTIVAVPIIPDLVDMDKDDLVIFEIGCGAGNRIGWLRNHLLSKGKQVRAIGVDYSQTALDFAKRHGIETHLGGAEELKQFGKADVLILSHVFEHMPDLDQALSDIEALIKHDGLVYVEVPGVNDLENKLEYRFSYLSYCVLAHTFNFCLTSLQNVFASRKLELVKGTEYVSAVFRKNPKMAYEMKSAFDGTMSALQSAAEKNRTLENREKAIGKTYLKSVAKALLGRST